VIEFIKTPSFQKKAAVLFIDESGWKSNKFPLKDLVPSDQIKSLLDSKQFQAKKDEMFPMVLGTTTLLLVGIGKKKDLTPTSLRTIIRKALLSGFLKQSKNIEIAPHDSRLETAEAVVEGILIGTYNWDKYKTKEEEDTSIASKNKNYFVVGPKNKALDDLITICEGLTLARDMVNDNADITTSDYFEKTIAGIIKGQKNITTEILGRKELKSKGLNLHLAVNQGSNKEPKLIIVRYQGAAKSAPYTAVIGKGITFDTGGLNLEPSGHMKTMKCDMSGAAAVVGTLKNAIALKLKKNIIFACGLAENAIGSNSYKPGDVIKSYSGKTVEIGNTDAEGRLVLADAISYIAKNYKPAAIIDIATLTGACVVALAHNHTGLVSSDQKLADKLLNSAKITDDWVWQLPHYAELKEAMTSKIADLSNISNTRGAGGTITAGEFLYQFTDGIKWAHLDIAGTAFVENGSRLYFGNGATGAGVRLLTDYLSN